MKMTQRLQLNSLKFSNNLRRIQPLTEEDIQSILSEKNKRVSWHWCTCRRSSNTSPYDFSCFVDCVWRCHTPGMDWICSLPSQDLRCSNQHARCSDIYNCIILQRPARDVTAASFVFAHAHIRVSYISQQDKSTHTCVLLLWLLL